MALLKRKKQLSKEHEDLKNQETIYQQLEGRYQNYKVADNRSRSTNHSMAVSRSNKLRSSKNQKRRKTNQTTINSEAKDAKRQLLSNQSRAQ